MVPISDSVRDSLDTLSSQICAAEDFIRRQPGGESASVKLDEESWGSSSFLEVQRDSENACEICVREYIRFTDSVDLPAGKPIEEYPVMDRILLCNYIPELLDKAVAAQEGVAKNAMEAAISIEQALAKLTDY